MVREETMQEHLSTRQSGRFPSLNTPVVLTRRCAPVAPETLLRVGQGHARFFWQAPTGHTVAAFGVVQRMQVRGADRFVHMAAAAEQLLATLRRAGDADAPAPVVLGGFAFDDRQAYGWEGFAPADFILPRVVLRTDAHATWLSVVAEDETRAEALWHESVDALYRVPTGGVATFPRVQRETRQPDEQTWREMVRQAIGSIRADVVQKVVLARTCRVETDAPVDPLAALARLQQRYRGCFLFLMEPTPGHAFFGATPEILADVHGSTLRTMALAGSIGRGATPQADVAQAAALLDSPKDRREHAFVVEAILTHLRYLADEITCAPEPTLLRLPNIQHLHTPITATLKSDVRIWDVVAQLHPTPAVGGVPRERALALIHELEPFSRGWYAAPVGIVDAAGNGTFVVAIRSALAVGRMLTLYAGAGIVADSDPVREWHETGLKFRPLLDAIGIRTNEA